MIRKQGLLVMDRTELWRSFRFVEVRIIDGDLNRATILQMRSIRSFSLCDGSDDILLGVELRRHVTTQSKPPEIYMFPQLSAYK